MLCICCCSKHSNAAQIVYLKLEPNARHTKCHCCCPRAEPFLLVFMSFLFFYFPLVFFGSFPIIFMSSFSFVCVCVCVSFRLFGFYYFSVKFMTRLPPVFFIVWPCHVLHSARACVSCFSDPTRSGLSLSPTASLFPLFVYSFSVLQLIASFYLRIRET